MTARMRFPTLLGVLAMVSACVDKITGPVLAPEPDRIAVTVTGATLMSSVGDTIAIEANVFDAGTTRIDGRALVWRVEPAGVMVDLGNGVFRAAGNGEARIIVALRDGVPDVRPTGYTVRQIADTIEVQVAQVATQLALASADTMFYSLGATRQLVTTLSDARGNTIPDTFARATWSSSDSTKVRVDATGRATSVGDGNATLRATFGSFERSVRFAVDAVIPLRQCVSVVVSGGAVESCSATLQLHVTERSGGSN